MRCNYQYRSAIENYDIVHSYYVKTTLNGKITNLIDFLSYYHQL